MPTQRAIAALESRPESAQQPAGDGVTIATPLPDGSIIHIVAYGDTLYEISQVYGVSAEEIMVNSGNSPLATDLREGDRLVIRFAFTATPTNDFTPTPIPVTPQPTKVYFTPTATATHTPSPSPTVTPTPPLSHRVLGNNKNVGGALMGAGLLGLLLLAYFGFIRRK